MSISLSKTHAAPCFKLLPLAVALAAALGTGAASAASGFTISTNSTSAQTLGSGSGQTGTVNAGVSLTVGSSSVAVTITGNNATLLNLGTIAQTSTGANAARAIRDNTGVTGLVITNGSLTNSTATITAADADVIQMNKAAGSVTLNNYGVMTSYNASAGGAQAVDFNAITTGANTLNNYATGVITAYDADSVRPGVNGVVYNAGKIVSIATSNPLASGGADGIDAQNNSGISITNDTTGTIEGARHGITGAQLNASTSFTMTITNNAGGVIRGDDGSGVNIDGVNKLEVVTVNNSGLIVGNGITGDGDGVDVDGLVNITNTATGIIRSTNAYSAVSAGVAYSEGITVGGGTITNSGLIEGLVSAGNTNALGRGITLTGNDLSTGGREGLYGNAVVVNNAGGVIRGQNDSAIVATGAASGYTVSITNNAGGTITGGGTATYAIQTGLDNDTLTNGGRIDGSSSGLAIDMGAGNNTLHIVGGSAVILGNISGGVGGTNALTINPGAGNTFAYASGISNFNSVTIQSGTVALSGVSSYTGSTVLSGGTLELDGANRLSSASALDLEGGTLKVADAAGADGQTFASLILGASSTLELDGSALTFNGLGTIAKGAALTVLDWDASSTAYAFRLLGDETGDSAFQLLLADTTIDGMSATYHFDGTYTDVTYALAAVPEPANVALMLAGFGVLGVVARRRKQAASA